MDFIKSSSILLIILCIIPTMSHADLTFFDEKATFLTVTGAAAEAPLVDFDFSAAPKTIGDLTYSLNSGSTNFGIGEFSNRISGPEIIVSGTDGIIVDIDKANPVFAFGFEFVEPELDPNLNGPFVESVFTIEFLNGGNSVGSGSSVALMIV